MATLTLRQTTPFSSGTNKSAPLTNAEVDANFNSLDSSKLERSGGVMTGTLTLVAGTTAVAPVKLQGGALLTTAELGALEFDASNLYFTPSTSRKTLAYTDSNITGTSAGWTTSRTVTFATSHVTGSFSINGTANVSDVALTISPTSNVTLGSLNVGSATGATTGQVRASGDIIAFASSDERLKSDITHISDALDKVKTLRGVMFTWNETAEAMGLSGKDTGVIAQDVEKVLPEVVTTREDGHMAVKYEKMIGLLIEAIKELDDKLNKCTCCVK
jgi:hypothetical protein